MCDIHPLMFIYCATFPPEHKCHPILGLCLSPDIASARRQQFDIHTLYTFAYFPKGIKKTTTRKKLMYSCIRRLNSLQVHKVAQRVVFNIYSFQKYAHVPFAAAELEMHQCVVSVSFERRMTPLKTGQHLAV